MCSVYGKACSDDWTPKSMCDHSKRRKKKIFTLSYMIIEEGLESSPWWLIKLIRWIPKLWGRWLWPWFQFASLWTHANCVFDILREVGSELNVSIFGPLKANNCQWVTFLNQTHVFEWYVIRSSSENKYQKDMKMCMCWKRDWTMCSKYDNHSRLNNQHSWGIHLWPY